MAIDFLDVEPVCFHAFPGVFALRLFRRGVERDRIRIVEENQIIEAPMTSQRTCLGGDALLHVAVAAQTDNVLIENFVLVSVEPRGGHLCRHGNANRVANTLTKRPRRAFHSRRLAKFRVARRF